MNEKIIQKLLLTAFLATLGPTAASADVAPTNSYGCKDAEAGDSCLTDDNKKGGCVTQTCSGLDYSNLDDGGTPTSRTYDCLICDTSAADDGGCSAVPHRTEKSDLFNLLSLLFQ